MRVMVVMVAMVYVASLMMVAAVVQFNILTRAYATRIMPTLGRAHLSNVSPDNILQHHSALLENV